MNRLSSTPLPVSCSQSKRRPWATLSACTPWFTAAAKSGRSTRQMYLFLDEGHVHTQVPHRVEDEKPALLRLITSGSLHIWYRGTIAQSLPLVVWNRHWAFGNSRIACGLVRWSGVPRGHPGLQGHSRWVEHHRAGQQLRMEHSQERKREGCCKRWLVLDLPRQEKRRGSFWRRIRPCMAV